jgi:hypothetical protein
MCLRSLSKIWKHIVKRNTHNAETNILKAELSGWKRVLAITNAATKGFTEYPSASAIRNEHVEYILLTVHRVMILGKWPTRRTVLYHVFIFIFNSLHVSSTSCSSSGETYWVNTTSGNCHSVSVTVSCAGRKWNKCGMMVKTQMQELEDAW